MAYCCKPDPPTSIEQLLPTTTTTTTTFITDVDLPYNAIILKSHSSTFPKGITNEYRQYRKSVPRRKIPIHELEIQFYIPFMEQYPNHFVYNQSMMEQMSNVFYEEIYTSNNTERMYRPLNDTERDEYVQLDIKNNGKKKPKNKNKTTLSESYTIYDIIQQTRIDLQSLSNHILKPTYELMLQDIETRILNNSNNNNIVQMNETTTTTIMNHEEIISIIQTIYTTFFHRPIPITATQVKKRKRCYNNNYNIHNDNDNSTTIENCIDHSIYSSTHHSTAGSSMNNNVDDDDNDSFMDILNVLDFKNELLIHDNDGNATIGINHDPPSTEEEEKTTLNEYSTASSLPIQSLMKDDNTGSCSNSDNDDHSTLTMNDNNYRNITRPIQHRTTTIDKTYETSIEFESVQSVMDSTSNVAMSLSIGVTATTTDTDSDTDTDYETTSNTNNNDGNDETTLIDVQNSLSSQQYQYQQQQQDRYGSCIGTSLGISGCNDDNHDDDDDDKYYHRRSQQLQFRRSNRSLFKRFGSRWDVDYIDIMNNTNNITGTRRTINTNNNNNTNTTLNDFKISRIVRWFYHRIIK